MKQYAHNITEIKALLKEEVLSGDSEKYNGCHWYSHTGEFLCRSICTSTMYHLELPDSTVQSFQVL